MGARSGNAPQWRLTLLLAGLAMFGPFSIDTFFPAFRQMAAEFGVDKAVMQQIISVYLLAYAAMSMRHGPLSDALGWGFWQWERHAARAQSSERSGWYGPDLSQSGRFGMNQAGIPDIAPVGNTRVAQPLVRALDWIESGKDRFKHAGIADTQP